MDEAYVRLAAAIVMRARKDLSSKKKTLRKSASTFFKGELWENIRDTFDMDEQWTNKMIDKWSKAE